LMNRNCKCTSFIPFDLIYSLMVQTVLPSEIFFCLSSKAEWEYNVAAPSVN